MKRKIRLFGILLVITALIIMQLPAAEADAATSASDFKMEGNTLIKYRGTEKNVSVPDTVEVIGENAFSGNTDIELVVLPESVNKIEAYAFWGCENLDNVVLGKGLTEVGDYAFTNCKGLKKMSIPSNIKSIGIKAFADCVNLTDITIAPEVFDIHETAFDGCYKLLIHCEIGTAADRFAEAFYERQKEMPEYEDVQDYPATPDDQQSQDVQEPESNVESDVNTIGATLVVGNQAVVFMDSTSLQVQKGMDDGEELTVKPQEQPVDGERGIPKFTIVDDRIVADQAYYRNSSLQKVTLPSGMEEIGQFAFARSSIAEIFIPEGVDTIGYGAFYHCDELASIELPQTVENVEPKAFDYTEWVMDFQENGTDDFLISGGVLVSYRGSASQVSVPDSVTVIGEAAFADCIHLSKIHFGNQLLQIKDRAFFNCGLSEVSPPGSLEKKGLMAFDEGTQIHYENNRLPQTSHELSAERLSNEAYRKYPEEQGTPGVTVTGTENVSAHLEGAARSYELSVLETAYRKAMEQAFLRSLYVKLPADMIVYDLQLTDSSNIPITKLGKQVLEVTMPVPEELLSQNISLYTLDRNGQLEELTAERIKLNGIDCFRFQIQYLSQIGVAGDGTEFDASSILEETDSMKSMSAPRPKTVPTSIRWAIGGMILMWGFICILWKKT